MKFLRLLAFAAVAALLVSLPRCGQAPPPAPATPPPPAAAAIEPPRLVVLCVVDQLATWVLDAGLPHCGPDGFQRLVRDGVQFPHCAFLHGCTETGPGHATLGTGAPASVHGIVRNQWWDPNTRHFVYCADDKSAEALPDLPEGKGKGPALLRVPTFGDAMKQQFGPAAKVVSVSWKDRAAILLAGRAANVAAWIEPTTGHLVTNKLWVASTPPWLAAFNERHVLDGFFGWKWERSGADSAYAGLVDDRPFEGVHGNGSKTRTLPQTLTGGREHPDATFYAVAYCSPVANEVVEQAALMALAGEDLGTDAVPDLFCVSFSATDTVGHTFGSDSVEARDTLLRLDRLLAQLLQQLDQRVGQGRYLFLLSADHGVGPTPEQAKLDGKDAGRAPVTSRAKAAAETALVAKYGKQEGKHYIAMAPEGVLFLDHSVVCTGVALPAAAARLREACSEAANAAAGAPGMATAFATWDLLQNGPGTEPIRRAMYYAADPDRSGDVLLVIKPYWLDGSLVSSHGTPHRYDREVPLLAMGPGLRAGSSCATAVSPGLCAVLAARLLSMPKLPAARDELPDGVLIVK